MNEIALSRGLALVRSRWPFAVFTGIISICLLVAVPSIVAAGPKDPGSIIALAASEVEAAQALGRPAPQPAFRPFGMTRIQLTISSLPMDPRERAGLPRYVRQSFSIEGRPLALLTTFRSPRPANSLDNTQVLNVRGTTVAATESQLSDGSQDVTYLWYRDGLIHVLHVNLVKGLDRALADRVMESIN